MSGFQTRANSTTSTSHKQMANNQYCLNHIFCLLHYNTVVTKHSSPGEGLSGKHQCSDSLDKLISLCVGGAKVIQYTVKAPR